MSIVELNAQAVKMVVVGVVVLGGIGAMAMKSAQWVQKVKTSLQETLDKMETTLETIAWSSGACADKLNFVVRRLERLLQSGDESARHLC